MNNLNKILSFILILLFGLFCFSLFKNIQYPLLWNDEADTAMFAQRILQFGYPKVYDGKNVLYQTQIVDSELITNEKFDASVEIDWLQYYLALPFVYFSQKLNDPYFITFILRIPFAIVGFLGLGILALIPIRLFSGKTHRLFFLSLFMFFELLSISLTLHLREMRYYSLLLFLTAALLYFYVRFHVYRNIKHWQYAAAIVILNLLILITYRPVFFILVLFILLHNLFLLLGHLKAKNFSSRYILSPKFIFHAFVQLAPVIFSIIASIPYIKFFRVFYFTSQMSKYYRFSIGLYIDHLLHILKYFWHFELLFPLIVVKVIMVFAWLKKNKRLPLSIKQKIHFSLLLSVFLVFYILLIARIPYFMFTRYFIILQPIMAIVLLIDAFIIFKLFSFHALTLLTILVFVFNVSKTWTTLKGHIYELTTPYEGPLDFIIPYIKQNFQNTENLVIATNYEEFSYMFYLGSKVTIGYVGNNLEEDLKVQPDIIIYRQGWGINPEIFNYFLRKEKYKVVSFPVYNYPLNNIPEFNFVISHLFKTKLATNEEEKLRIFVREKLIQK